MPLVLALALGLIQAIAPIIGARAQRRRADAARQLDGADAVRFCWRWRFWR